VERAPAVAVQVTATAEQVRLAVLAAVGAVVQGVTPEVPELPEVLVPVVVVGAVALEPAKLVPVVQEP